jgi:predicted negative regulator of RcsB-dependent stress response
MASSNKAALKAAKAALDAKNYDEAATEARKVLEGEPNHYHACALCSVLLLSLTIEQKRLSWAGARP